MLATFRTGIASRALAALAALALTGAPRLASALRPEAAHVCQCRAEGKPHRCACPICAKLARDARRGAAKDLPPCHRGAALAALADEEARDVLAASLPCLEPTCGVSLGTRLTPASGDSYLAPRPPALSPPRGVERLVARAVREADLPAVPDVPPPKRP